MMKNLISLILPILLIIFSFITARVSKNDTGKRGIASIRVGDNVKCRSKVVNLVHKQGFELSLQKKKIEKRVGVILISQDLDEFFAEYLGLIEDLGNYERNFRQHFASIEVRRKRYCQNTSYYRYLMNQQKDTKRIVRSYNWARNMLDQAYGKLDVYKTDCKSGNLIICGEMYHYINKEKRRVSKGDLGLNEVSTAKEVKFFTEGKKKELKKTPVKEVPHSSFVSHLKQCYTGKNIKNCIKAAQEAKEKGRNDVARRIYRQGCSLGHRDSCLEVQ